ncbi:MAG: hypothetical protein Q7T36_15625 [Fluviicoccus sp.]|uniref:hypothetical protein n=1 Tax=Fluviicoccus sp. TaxID=2003552 RepID=UPI002721F243|nr:hypothetical protein [Fluviicoccus sp.]MDO8331894.1 hypothetical protein [Fluviicoccus sp.]
MQTYKNGKTAILAFKITEESITIQYKDGRFYLYTRESLGHEKLSEMKKLALSGEGLGNFVSNKAARNYAGKWILG